MEKGGQRWTIGAAVAFALWGAQAAPALAQDAPEESQTEAGLQVEEEEIVVIGYRKSLNAALEDKREAVGAIDAIVAEDIADFPDLNLAESIQRIPGVSITRDAGEGRQLSVRGLGAQFTRVRINGMEAQTTTGSTDAAGGTNRDRGFDFNVFASELFNGITVRKTAAAEVEEGSLGATIDLKTPRPFDYGGFTLVTGVQGGFNDLSDDFNPRGAFLVSNTFADGKFGALVSAAYTDRQLLDNGSSTVRWQNNGAFQGFDPTYTGSAAIADVNTAFRPRIPRYDVYEHDQQRLGVTGALQFKPSDKMQFNLDALYSKFDAERTESNLEAPVFSNATATGLGAVDVVDAQVINNGINGLGVPTSTLVYGVFNDVDIRSESRFDELSTEFRQLTLDGEYRLTETLKIHGIVGRSESEHDNPISTTLIYDAFDVDGYTFDYRNSSREPIFNYGTADVTNPATWQLSQIRLRPATVDNDVNNFGLDAEWSFNESIAFKVGAQLKQYENTSTNLNRSNGTTANQESIIPAGIDPLNVAPYSKTVTLEGINLAGGTPATWVIPDVRGAAGLLNLYDPNVFPVGLSPILANNFQVEEDDTGGFLQMDFQTELFSLPLRGNVGVRYVQTDQTASGFVFTSGSPLATTVDRDYSDTLPSLNLVASVTDNFLVRFGASKAVSRPNLINLNPGASVAINGANKAVIAGNPLLDPLRSKSYDLSFEWYFAPESLVGVAVFYKDIESFVQTIRSQGQFNTNPVGLPDSVALAACGAGVDPVSCLANWQFNLPANTPGGELTGVEFSYQQPFTFLPGAFTNFGAIFNYTYVDSTIQYLGVNAAGANVVTAEDDLVGLSKNASNLTLYYDNGTFGARVSGAYRDEFFTTVPGRNLNDFEGTVSALTIDFSSSYKLTDNLEFSLEGLNLTDEFNDQYVDLAANRPSFYHHTGRQYLLGARYKF